MYLSATTVAMLPNRALHQPSKEVGFQYTVMYIIYGLHQVHKSHFIHLRVRNLFIDIVLCQRENKNILVLDIESQNTTYVIAVKGTHAIHMNLKFQ